MMHLPDDALANLGIMLAIPFIFGFVIGVFAGRFTGRDHDEE